MPTSTFFKKSTFSAAEAATAIVVRRLRPAAGQVIRVDGASDHYPVAATLHLHE